MADESRSSIVATLTKLEEIVRCCVCLETLSFPKTLRCQHSFCIGCLAKILKTTLLIDGVLNHHGPGPTKSISIVCPSCNAEHEDITALGDLPTSFTVVQVLDTVHEISGNNKMTHLCCSCSRFASDICLTCLKKYCPDCLGKGTHSSCDFEKQSGGEKAKHFTAEIPKKSEEEGYRCRKHHIIFEYYCTICEEPVCLDCFLLLHRNHQTKEIGAVKGEVQELLQKLNTINTKNIVNSAQGWSDASLLIKKIDENQMQLSKDIKQLHGKLEKFLKMLIEKVNAFCLEQFAAKRQNILQRFTTEEVLLSNSDTVKDLCSFVQSKLSDDLMVAFQSSVLKEMFTSCQEKSSALEDTMDFLKIKEESLDESATLEISEEECLKSMIRIFDNLTLKILNDDRKITLKDFLQTEFKSLFPSEESKVQENIQVATAIECEAKTKPAAKKADSKRKVLCLFDDEDAEEQGWFGTVDPGKSKTPSSKAKGTVKPQKPKQDASLVAEPKEVKAKPAAKKRKAKKPSKARKTVNIFGEDDDDIFGVSTPVSTYSKPAQPDTQKKLEKSKQEAKIEKKSDNLDIEPTVMKKHKAKSFIDNDDSGLFGDEQDDLFTAPSKPQPKKESTASEPNQKSASSLFSDGEDDLFSTSTKPAKKEEETKPEKSRSKSKQSMGSIEKVEVKQETKPEVKQEVKSEDSKKPKEASKGLLGEEEDGDLFSEKKASSEPQPKKESTASEPKQKSATSLFSDDWDDLFSTSKKPAKEEEKIKPEKSRSKSKQFMGSIEKLEVKQETKQEVKQEVKSEDSKKPKEAAKGLLGEEDGDLFSEKKSSSEVKTQEVSNDKTQDTEEETPTTPKPKNFTESISLLCGIDPFAERKNLRSPSKEQVNRFQVSKEKPKDLQDIEPVRMDPHEGTKPLEKDMRQFNGHNRNLRGIQERIASRQVGKSLRHRRFVPPSKMQPTMAENAFVRYSKKQTWVQHEERLSTPELMRKVQRILNMLTLTNFDRLVGKMKEIPINTVDRLKRVTDLIFEKALSEPGYTKVYAQLCDVLAKQKITLESCKGKNVTFKRILLNKCQYEFERMKTDEQEMEKDQKKHFENAEEEKRWQEEVALKKHLNKERSLGNIRFIGELFKLKMLTETIMHTCVTMLLKARDEESLECFCQLLKIIGKDLDHERAKPRTDQYFAQLDKIISHKKVSPRIIFMLQEVKRLRETQWVSRRSSQHGGNGDGISTPQAARSRTMNKEEEKFQAQAVAI